ncbi:MAG TPA: hypothetical protein VJC04_03910 [Candidatus Paceibacterota bacterium]
MLTPYLNSQFVEKVITDRYGRQFRCLFLVALIDGETKGKLISVQKISGTVGLFWFRNSPTVPAKHLLSVFHTSKKILTEYACLPIVSSLIPKDFSFVMSQMTRAPSSY